MYSEQHFNNSQTFICDIMNLMKIINYFIIYITFS